MQAAIVLGAFSALMAFMSVRLRFSFRDVDTRTRNIIEDVSWYGLLFACLFCYLGFMYR